MPKVSITPKITVDAFVWEKLKSNPGGLAFPIFRRKIFPPKPKFSC